MTESSQTLRDIFTAFAAEAVKLFPHLKGRLLILDMNEYKAYGYHDIDPQKTGLTPDTARTYLGQHHITQGMRENSKRSSCAEWNSEHTICTIFINRRIDKNELKNVSEKTKKMILAVLDHEVAHLGIKDGSDGLGSDSPHRIIKESIADAYALLRHYQRSGIKNGCPDPVQDPVARAYSMIYGDTPHFTSFMQDEIQARKHMIDFERIQPQELQALAWRFAMKYAPPAAVVKSLHGAFEAVKKGSGASIEERCKALAKLTLETSSYYSFRFGRSLLAPVLEDYMSFNGQQLLLRGEYWDEVRRKFKEKEFQFESQEILFNMPLVEKAEPQAAPVKTGNKPLPYYLYQ